MSISPTFGSPPYLFIFGGVFHGTEGRSQCLRTDLPRLIAGGNKGGVACRQRHLQPASARLLRPRRRLNIGARLSAVKGALLQGEADVLPNQGRTKVLQYRRRLYLPG